MNQRFYFLLAFLLMGVVQIASANHYVGVEFQYVCTGPCDIRVTGNYYRSCNGGTGTFGSPVFFSGGPGCPVPNLLNTSPISITDITPLCPTSISSCNSASTVNGFEIFSRDYDFSYCGAPNTCIWTLNWNGCCRSGAITTGGANSQYGVSSQTLNAGVVPCNNSPQFPIASELLFCAGQPASFSAAATDPDGDSLSYSLGPCSGINYIFPYTAANPFGPSWQIAIDAESGNMTLTPTPGNQIVTVLCVYIEEWRNNVLLNTSVREWQLIVIPCPLNQQPQFTAYTNVSPNVMRSGDIFYTPMGNTVCLDLGATDGNGASQNLDLFWDQSIPGATFTDPNNISITDTVSGLNPVGRFCFTPPGAGIYRFFVRAQDNACPYTGRATRQIIIDVRNMPPSASATPVSCNQVNFAAQAGGASNVTYTWSGPGGLSSNLATFSHTYSAPGIYAWQVIISNGSTLNDTLNGSVTVAPSLSYQALVSPPGASFICTGQNFSLTGQSGYASYLWSTGATTAAISPTMTGNYGLTVTDNQGCQYFDSAQVIVQAPPYLPLISGNSTISPCNNGLAQLSLPNTFAAYNWSNGSTSNNISITTPGFYQVTVTDAGGCLSLDSITVTAASLDISGTITTSTSGSLIQQRVWLVEIDTAARTLYAVDSTFTDNLGFYQFCGITADIFMVKAAPDSATYPMELPTYATAGATWMSANAYFQGGLPYQVNFSTLFGPHPGGPGFTGGAINMGAGRLNLLTGAPQNHENIDPAIENASFSLVPNPADVETQVEIGLPHPTTVQIQLADEQGRIVFAAKHQFLPGGLHQFTLPTAALAAGSYWVIVQAENNRRIRKLLVIHS